MKVTKNLIILLCAMALGGCAYHFQDRKNPLQKMGVERIYVTSFKNHTYRPGIEQLFTTAMIREIQKSRSFTLVSSEADADATLSGDVLSADISVADSKGVILSTGPDVSVSVGTQFSAAVVCDIRLIDKFNRTLFRRSETGSKLYPGATNVGEAGATNSLINDSEQRLAIQFLASQMMASVYQRLIDIF
ncbi:MAG: LPS assembly lipoprotein LptE [Bdellovibrionota bacterium]